MKKEQQQQARRKGVPTVMVAVFGIPILAACILAAWIVSLESTVGLLVWNPPYRAIIYIILGAGFLPLLPGLAALAASRAGRQKTAHAASVAAAVLSVLVVVSAAGAGVFLSVGMHTLSGPVPALHRLETAGSVPLVRLAFSSDCHIGSGRNSPEATRSILRTVNSGGYDAFFALGDFSETGYPGTDLQKAAELFSGELKDVPIATIMGNHDGLVGGAWRFGKYFNSERYYRVDSGKNHVIALTLLWGTESFDRAQKDWLAETLASIPREDTVIVISHCYFRASGYTDPETGMEWFDHPAMIREISPMLENGGVDLVVSGHNHFMEYLEKSATAYAVIGTFGGKLDPDRTHVSPDSRWFDNDHFGFLEVVIGERGMELTFRDETGKTLHTEKR